MNENKVREEYQDGRTVYKISKQKSISPCYNHGLNADRQLNNQRSSVESAQSVNDSKVIHNLSVRFEQIHNSDPKKDQESDDNSDLVDVNFFKKQNHKKQALSKQYQA